MNTNELITLLSVVLPLTGAGAGYWIRHIIEKKRELLSEINKERREHYQLFIDLIAEIFKLTNKGETMPVDEMREKLYEFYKKYLLYASPRVINSFGDLFQLFYNTANTPASNRQTRRTIKAMTKVMKNMRKDIGLKNRRLGRNGEKIFRAFANDYDAIMKRSIFKK